MSCNQRSCNEGPGLADWCVAVLERPVPCWAMGQGLCWRCLSPERGWGWGEKFGNATQTTEPMRASSLQAQGSIRDECEAQVCVGRNFAPNRLNVRCIYWVTCTRLQLPGDAVAGLLFQQPGVQGHRVPAVGAGHHGTDRPCGHAASRLQQPGQPVLGHRRRCPGPAAPRECDCRGAERSENRVPAPDPQSMKGVHVDSPATFLQGSPSGHASRVLLTNSASPGGGGGLTPPTPSDLDFNVGEKMKSPRRGLLDQAQVRTPYTPLFWGHSRTIPQGMVPDVQPLVKSSF